MCQEWKKGFYHVIGLFKWNKQGDDHIVLLDLLTIWNCSYVLKIC
jgi:hypothetical protein